MAGFCRFPRPHLRGISRKKCRHSRLYWWPSKRAAHPYGADDRRHCPVVSGKTQNQVLARSMIQSAVT